MSEPFGWAIQNQSGQLGRNRNLPDTHVIIFDWSKADRVATIMTEAYGEQHKAVPVYADQTHADWLPISSMPVDDTMILACTDDGRIMIWRGCYLSRNIAGPTPEHLKFPATFWQHLPAPPTPS